MLSFTVAVDVQPVNTTISGRTCQRWDSQSPHLHPYSNLSAFENYCMNPTEDAASWCYTTDNRRRTEFCPLPVSDGKLLDFLRNIATQHTNVNLIPKLQLCLRHHSTDTALVKVFVTSTSIH